MLKIVKDTAKSLHSRCAPVEDPRSPEIKATLDEMTKYLKDSQNPAFREKNPSVREGVGLAAPQVGINKRMLVNPLIVSQSIRQCYLASGEGCLSVDQEHPGYAYRAYKITVKAYDAHRGEDIEIRAIGFDAIVLQHEIDHLNGILFYDRIDKRNPFKEIPDAVAI